MKIVIDLTAISYHVSGIERYALGITDKLIDIDKNNVYILIFRNKVYDLFKSRIDGIRINSIVLKGKNRLYFIQVTLLKELRKINADKYLFLAFPSPFFFKKKGIINAIHDMGAWDSPMHMKYLSRCYFKLSYFIAGKVSERIITVSNFTKKRIIEILGVPAENISVIYSAVYEKLKNTSEESFSKLQQLYCLPDKFIMTLATLEPRKNLSLLLDAFSLVTKYVDYDLVLIGRKGWKIDKLLKKYKSESRIHITGFIKDEHVSGIYKNALCFVFPSLYEGFGLPPVESLSLGTPVISSDAASLPEILQNQAVYFHNNSLSELKSLLLTLSSNLKDMPKNLNTEQRDKYTFLYASKQLIALL